MQRENKWQDRFDEKFEDGLESEVIWYGEGRIKEFIQSEIDMERERIVKVIKEVAPKEMCTNLTDGQPDFDIWCEEVTDIIIEKLTVDNSLDTQNK